MKSTITIRISEEMKVELERISADEHVPVSDIIRDSIRKFLVVRRFRRLRGKVLPFAEAQGLLTDEDVFDALS